MQLGAPTPWTRARNMSCDQFPAQSNSSTWSAGRGTGCRGAFPRKVGHLGRAGQGRPASSLGSVGFGGGGWMELVTGALGDL